MGRIECRRDSIGYPENNQIMPAYTWMNFDAVGHGSDLFALGNTRFTV